MATLAEFKVGRLLGEGGFGRVYLVRLRETGELYALKVLIKRRLELMGVDPGPELSSHQTVTGCP